MKEKKNNLHAPPYRWKSHALNSHTHGEKCQVQRETSGTGCRSQTRQIKSTKQCFCFLWKGKTEQDSKGQNRNRTTTTPESEIPNRRIKTKQLTTTTTKALFLLPPFLLFFFVFCLLETKNKSSIFWYTLSTENIYTDCSVFPLFSSCCFLSPFFLCYLILFCITKKFWTLLFIIVTRETKRREIEWSSLLILLYGHPGNKFLFFPSNLIIFHLDFGLFSWLEIWKGKVFVLNPGRFLLSGFEWKLETLFSKVLNFDFLFPVMKITDTMRFKFDFTFIGLLGNQKGFWLPFIIGIQLIMLRLFTLCGLFRIQDLSFCADFCFCCTDVVFLCLNPLYWLVNFDR